MSEYLFVVRDYTLGPYGARLLIVAHKDEQSAAKRIIDSDPFIYSVTHIPTGHSYRRSIVSRSR
jgi:hypothetical protein